MITRTFIILTCLVLCNSFTFPFSDALQHRSQTIQQTSTAGGWMFNRYDHALTVKSHQYVAEDPKEFPRRKFLRQVAFVGLTGSTSQLATPSRADAAQPNGLVLTTTNSGLKWADAKVGSGEPLRPGALASIDYSMASTAGRFPQIYTTKDKGTPYRWQLGDGSTIAGIELAILGDPKDESLPPMRPGGIRRVIVPASLGYQSLTSASSNAQCIAGSPGSIGPIPPKDSDLGAYQRWYQFYCNPRIPYQPDLVLDIKLYGSR